MEYPNYLNNFFYQPVSGVLDKPGVVDFNRMFSVSTKNFREELLRNKIYELDSVTRRLLKQKIGYYFSHENTTA